MMRNYAVFCLQVIYLKNATILSQRSQSIMSNDAWNMTYLVILAPSTFGEVKVDLRVPTHPSAGTIFCMLEEQLIRSQNIFFRKINLTNMIRNHTGFCLQVLYFKNMTILSQRSPPITYEK